MDVDVELENGMTLPVLAESTWKAFRHAAGTPVPEAHTFENASEVEITGFSRLAQWLVASVDDLEGKSFIDLAKEAGGVYLGEDAPALSPFALATFEAAVRHGLGLCEADDWGRNLEATEAGWSAWVETKLKREAIHGA